MAWPSSVNPSSGSRRRGFHLLHIISISHLSGTNSQRSSAPRRRNSLRRKHHSIVSGHFSAVGSDSWGIAGRCADQAIARRPGPAAGGCAHCGSHWEEALCWMEHVNENEKKSEKTASSAALPCAACLAAARTLRIYWRSQRRLRGFWMCTQSMYNYIPPCVALLPAPDCRGSRSM